MVCTWTFIYRRSFHINIYEVKEPELANELPPVQYLHVIMCFPTFTFPQQMGSHFRHTLLYKGIHIQNTRNSLQIPAYILIIFTRLSRMGPQWVKFASSIVVHRIVFKASWNVMFPFSNSHVSRAIQN